MPCARNLWRRRLQRRNDTPAPREVPSLIGSVSSAGTDKRGARSKKRKVQEAKQDTQDGGHALEARGEVRQQGIAVPAGNEHTCLPEQVWTGLKNLMPNLKLTLKSVRASIPSSATSADPNFTMAKNFAAGYGVTLQYNRHLNNPKALFNCKEGTFLVQLRLEITTEPEVRYENHFVTIISGFKWPLDRQLTPCQSADRSRRHRPQLQQASYEGFLPPDSFYITLIKYEYVLYCLSPLPRCYADQMSSLSTIIRTYPVIHD